MRPATRQGLDKPRAGPREATRRSRPGPCSGSVCAWGWSWSRRWWWRSPSAGGWTAGWHTSPAFLIVFVLLGGAAGMLNVWRVFAPRQLGAAVDWRTTTDCRAGTARWRRIGQSIDALGQFELPRRSVSLGASVLFHAIEPDDAGGRGAHPRRAGDLGCGAARAWCRAGCSRWRRSPTTGVLSMCVETIGHGGRNVLPVHLHAVRVHPARQPARRVPAILHLHQPHRGDAGAARCWSS